MNAPRFTIKPFDAYNAARMLPTRWYVLDTSWSDSLVVATFDTVGEALDRANALNTL